MMPDLIVAGASAGGLTALKFLLEKLPGDFSIPMIIVLHINPQSDDFWIKNLDQKCALFVKEAEDKEEIQKGTVYFAPPDYHVLIEDDRTITLSMEEKVNYSRPSIDVLFETAADAYKNKVMGIVLTGSSSDGSIGLKCIKEKGGVTVVQDPSEAQYKVMPDKAIQASSVDYILSLERISQLLLSFFNR